ncbi:hypothetical protein EJB05_21146, partial [Eragrostis curvula]
MPVLIPRIDHHADSPCYDPPSECSPLPAPPVLPIPLPPPPSSPSSHGRATFVTALITAGSVLAVLIICLSIFLCVRHRRQQRERRRQQALFGAAMVSAVAAADGFDLGGPGLEVGGGVGVVHHAWHIRTVGLDEAAIESIALTRYRADVFGGASDCAVCLGEFSDGELLRLLPKCAHAFHVACIDTWLRAHVNCPLCRARVLDPDAAAAVEQGDPPAGADAAGAEQAASGNGATEHEQVDQQASDHGELRLQIDPHDDRSTSQGQPHHHPSPRGHNFRRVASMDSQTLIVSPEEEAPEDEQDGGEKQGTGGTVHRECELSPGCSDHQKNHRGMKRSLSVGSRWALVSRHCRRSSSLLPL